jgi:hypothetical protein
MRCFLLFLLMLGCVCADGRGYSKCYVYIQNEEDTSLKALKSISYYDKDGKLTRSTIFCREGDTSCKLYRISNAYDAKGRLIDSLSIDRKGDTENTNLLYNAGGQRMKAQTLFTEKLPTEKGEIKTIRRIETEYYSYNTAGRLITTLKETTMDGKLHFLGRHKYYYDKEGREIIDSSFTPFARYDPEWTPDTSKWIYNGSRTVTKYTTNGYERRSYSSGNKGLDTQFLLSYKKDKRGRITEERRDLGSFIVTTSYGYFPDMRVLKVTDIGSLGGTAHCCIPMSKYCRAQASMKSVSNV